ncbi:VWA domain-containing protein [Streptomyces sp. NPDC051320]|uniref:VWA domain-containing protein n=1 Tax=Streptomyces sp. NPDC051320 TaxID=3154644 RepID=UPI003438A194
MLFNRKKSHPTAPPMPTAPASAATAVDFGKVPVGLVSLVKSAAVSLEKKGLAGQRAAVYLVVDRSYSMRDYYRNGAVQDLANQVLALSVNLDDDGVVPLIMFDSQPYPMVDVSLDRYTDVVAEQHRLHGGELTMSGTEYTIAMRAVMEHYLASECTTPALVIFQTDGDPQDTNDTRLLLAQASKLPIFWSFVGFGPYKVSFLQELDNLPGRLVDNASYFHAGKRPAAVADGHLYDGITKEFGPWLAAARSKNLLP